MPAVAAHHQFGTLVAQELCPEIQALITAHQALFTLGLQGPDLLFYYKPLGSNPISSLGHALHCQPGYTLFEQALTHGLHADAPQLAYLLGVCCHYGLDRSAHPHINQASHHNDTAHRTIESAFDRHIQVSFNLCAKRLGCLPNPTSVQPIAQLYGLPTPTIATALRTFRCVTWLLDMLHSLHLVDLLGTHGNGFTALCLPNRSTISCDITMAYFTQAIAPTVALLSDVYQAAISQSPCPTACKENFEGCLFDHAMVQ